MTKRKSVSKVDATNKKNETRVECNPWKSEQWDIEDGRISIKYPIHLTKDRLNLLYRICDTLEQPPGLYLAQALYEKIDSDLHSPQFLGKAYCDNLLSEWNVNKDNLNDYHVLQLSTQK